MFSQSHIESILLQGQSRNMVDQAIAWTANDPKRFATLVKLMHNHPEQRVKNRAAWALSYLAVDHPQWLKPHWNTFVNLLADRNISNSVRRNLVRFMQEVEIPSRHQGNIANRCFQLLNDPNEDIAIRAFSMTILFNMTHIYPEMAAELILSIQALLPYGSKALQNKGPKLLQKLETITSGKQRFPRSRKPL